jgi:hypothetical protein
MVKAAEYTSADHGFLGKRKKLEDDFVNGPLKKQRTRVRYAVSSPYLWLH